MQEKIPSASSKQSWHQAARWLALSGVVGPVAFVVAFTLLGALRPGYSAIRQAVSDLGVGSNAWVMNTFIVLDGLLLIVFAICFTLSMRTVLSQGSRWFSAVLLALPGLGLVIAGVFTEAPETLTIHWMVGASLLFISPVIVFPLIWLMLRHDARWRGWGLYALIAGIATLVLVTFMFWVFTPGTPLASLQFGGLMERVVMIEIEAWYVVFGWHLFVLGGKVGS